MTQIAWALAFLLFDREAGRPRPAALTGLAVVVLTLASHQVMSGPWLLAEFSTATRPPAATTSSPTSLTTCRTEAGRP